MIHINPAGADFVLIFLACFIAFCILIVAADIWTRDAEDPKKPKKKRAHHKS